MKKLSTLLLSIVLSAGVLAGCSNGDNNKSAKEQPKPETKTVAIASPDGLPTMSIAKLIKEKPEIKENYKVDYSIKATPDELSTTVMKGEADIAIVPSNMAAIAYNKTKDYSIAGTTGFGSLYLVSTEDINGYDDLKGMTILNIGKGMTPDITTQTILKDRDLDVKSDVTLDYVNAVSELVPMVISGKANTAVVPEPALSALMTKKEDVKIFKNLNDEYKELNDSKYGFPQATVIVKTSLLKDNKEFVASFLTQVNDSVEWANSNKSELASYCAEIGVSTEKPMIEKSIERANLKYVPISDTKKEYTTYYNYLFVSNPKSLGGIVPDEGIFMEK
jgi:NitT/TauT family transport system substrate-binding protein